MKKHWHLQAEEAKYSQERGDRTNSNPNTKSKMTHARAYWNSSRTAPDSATTLHRCVPSPSNGQRRVYQMTATVEYLLQKKIPSRVPCFVGYSLFLTLDLWTHPICTRTYAKKYGYSHYCRQMDQQAKGWITGCGVEGMGREHHPFYTGPKKKKQYFHVVGSQGKDGRHTPNFSLERYLLFFVKAVRAELDFVFGCFRLPELLGSSGPKLPSTQK